MGFGFVGVEVFARKEGKCAKFSVAFAVAMTFWSAPSWLLSRRRCCCRCGCTVVNIATALIVAVSPAILPESKLIWISLRPGCFVFCLISGEESQILIQSCSEETLK